MGNTLDPDCTSTISLFRAHETASRSIDERIQEEKVSRGGVNLCGRLAKGSWLFQRLMDGDAFLHVWLCEGSGVWVRLWILLQVEHSALVKSAETRAGFQFIIKLKPLSNLIKGTMCLSCCAKSSLCLQTRLQNLDTRRQSLFSTVHTYSLFMNLKNFVCNIGEDAELLMSLYDPDQSEFIRSAV